MYLYARSQYPQRLTKGRQWLLISHMLSLSQPAACTSTWPGGIVSSNSYFRYLVHKVFEQGCSIELFSSIHSFFCLPHCLPDNRRTLHVFRGE